MTWRRANSFQAVALSLTAAASLTFIVAARDSFPARSEVDRAPAAPALKQVAAFDLPGPSGKRFDYLTIDDEDRYLLSAHLGAGLLYVIDLRTNKVLNAVGDVPGIEGVEYVPELKKVYTSDWYENKIGVVDLKQMKVIAKLPSPDKPDGSAYAAPFHKLFVSAERGKAEVVIDVQQDKVTDILHFASETGMPQFDPVSKLIYLNLQDQNIFAVIDPKNDKVVGRFDVSPCKGNHGMALDLTNHLAFLSCEENNLMAVFGLDSHRVLATFPLADGPDVIKFDGGLRRIYVACYSGFISVFQEKNPTHFVKLQDFKTAPKMHSLAIDQRTHRLYAPEQEENGKPVARMVVYEPTNLP